MFVTSLLALVGAFNLGIAAARSPELCSSADDSHLKVNPDFVFARVVKHPEFAIHVVCFVLVSSFFAVRLQPGETATAEEIKEFCKGQVRTPVNLADQKAQCDVTTGFAIIGQGDWNEGTNQAGVHQKNGVTDRTETRAR